MDFLSKADCGAVHSELSPHKHELFSVLSLYCSTPFLLGSADFSVAEVEIPQRSGLQPGVYQQSRSWEHSGKSWEKQFGGAAESLLVACSGGAVNLCSPACCLPGQPTGRSSTATRMLRGAGTAACLLSHRLKLAGSGGKQVRVFPYD